MGIFWSTMFVVYQTPCEKISESWYDNGQKKREEKYYYKKLQYAQGWYRNGQQMYQENYFNGRFHGKTERWYESGQIYMRCYYLDSYPHGKAESWHENGKRHVQCTYLNNLLHGKYNIWDVTGKLIKSEYYIFNYQKKHLLIIFRTLRKAKYIRLAKMTKTKAFNEWWYHPDNPGGKLAKKKLSYIVNT
jgi:antitoxin component YwqK of YwqJK toxin-antitoxin module